MKNTDNQQDQWLLNINFDLLMDLRIYYAFKLLFSKGDPRLLISLLSAIFANKKIKRVIKSLTIKNPYLDKESDEDKLSILDIRAELDDGTNILIEMHLYGLIELKSKTVRAWARVYAEDLEVGGKYADQPPTVIIAFADGQIRPLANAKKSVRDKIHRCCMIVDIEDFDIFTDAMELHYIDMKAFAEAVNEKGSINIDDTEEVMFAKWLSVITQKEITNKAIIEDAYKDEEEIKMAVSTLVRHSEDKYKRQAYQRRKDDIYFYNKEKLEYESKLEQERGRAEQERSRAEQERNRAEQEQLRAEEAEATIADQAKLIAKLQSLLNEK